MRRCPLIHMVCMTVLVCFACAAGNAAEEAAAEAAPEAPEPPPRQLVPIDQVQIQVWISQTDEQGRRQLGNNLNYSRFTRWGQVNPGIEHDGSAERIVTDTVDIQDPNFDTVLPAPSPGPYPENLRQTNFSITPHTALPGGGQWTNRGQVRKGAGLTYDIVLDSRGTIEGAFRATESRTDTDLISKPELVVVQGAKATVNAGEEIPYQKVTWKNAQPQLEITWRNIGVQMQLTPTLIADDMVELSIEDLSVTDQLPPKVFGNLRIPVFSTRSQKGVVIVPNGQTLVIGGLNSRIVKRNERRVPILGRIPILGVAFRGRETDSINSQLLIFVSPTKIDLRNFTDRMDNAMNFWREDKWRNLERIQQEIDLMPDEI